LYNDYYFLLPRAGRAFTFFQSPKKVNKKGLPLKAIFCFAKTAASSGKRKSSLLNPHCGLSLGNGFFPSGMSGLRVVRSGSLNKAYSDSKINFFGNVHPKPPPKGEIRD